MAVTSALPGSETRELVSRDGGSHFRADIEGLRAVAVLLVISDHILGWPSGGFVGVDVFFVISGYLITGLLIRELEQTGVISLRRFYLRRVRRLLPAATATLAVTTAAAWLLLQSDRAWQATVDALWASAVAANINFALNETNYFASSLPPSPLQHFWSLSVEEQFYLFWPAVLIGIYFATRRSGITRGTIVVVALGVSCASLAWSIHVTQSSPSTAYFSTLARAWELALGALTFLGATLLHRLGAWARTTGAWIGLAALLACAVAIEPSDPFPGATALLPTLATAMIIGLGPVPRGPGSTRVLGSAPMRYVGKISYSLYLWHWPAVVLLGSLLPPDSLPFYVAAVSATVFLSVASFHLIEDPFRQSRERRRATARSPEVTRHRAIGWTAALTAVVIGMWSFLLEEGSPRVGAPALVASSSAQVPLADSEDPEPQSERSQAIEAAISSTEWPVDLAPPLGSISEDIPPEDRAGCSGNGPDDPEACTFDSQPTGKIAVVMGDSIAITWLPGLRSVLAPQGFEVRGLMKPSCPAVDAEFLTKGVLNEECTQHREWAFSEVERLQPDIVIMSQTPTNISSLAEGTPATQQALWRDGMSSTLVRLNSSGAKVAVLSPAPGGPDPASCITRVSSPEDCLGRVDETWLAASQAESAAASANGAAYVDTRPWFCNGRGVCPLYVGTTVVRRDDVHLTPEYSTDLAPELTEVLSSLTTSA